jgi:hypothetical protein
LKNLKNKTRRRLKLAANNNEPLIKEHKYGCSIHIPKCPNCNKFYNSYGPIPIQLATGGFHYPKFFVHCSKFYDKSRCNNVEYATDEELAILNKFSEPSRESWETRVLFPQSTLGGPNYVSKIYTK